MDFDGVEEGEEEIDSFQSEDRDKVVDTLQINNSLGTLSSGTGVTGKQGFT